MTEIFKRQIASLDSLDHNEKSVATIQTLRMSLVMLKYSLHKEDLYDLFNLYDNELKFLLLEENIADDIEYTEDNHELEEECCVKKEEFSDDDKEDSSWASRLSDVKKERKIITVTKYDTSPLLMRPTGPFALQIKDCDPVTPKQLHLLQELHDLGYHIPNYRKLLDVLEMYRDEDESVISNTNVFRGLFEDKHGHVILEYLKKD